MSTQFIDGLAIEVEGQGAPVVCIHGLGGTSNTWSPLMSALQGRKVVRLDLPGSGRSSAQGSLSIESLVDSVSKAMQQLGIEQADLLGHSLGTIVCQHLAVQKPHLVRSMALFGPLACPPDAARPNIRARADKAAKEGAAGMQEIADQIVQGATSAKTKATQTAVLALVRESVMRQDPLGYSRTCSALADAMPAKVEEFKGNVLLVTGSEDGVAPPAAVRVLAERFAQASVVVLDDCGHWTTFERASDCVTQLRAFIGEGASH